MYSFTLDDVESGDPDLKVVIEPPDLSSLGIVSLNPHCLSTDKGGKVG